MHVEALTYSRQTLAYAPPHELGDARRPAAGALPGDVEVPGGTLAPGIDRRRTASSSTTRSGRTRRRWHRSASPARRSPTPSSRPSSKPAAIARGNSGATPAGHGAARATPSVRSTGSPSATACGRSAAIARPRNWRRMHRSCSSTGSRPTPGAAGPAGACRPRPNGKRPPSASRRRTAHAWPTAVGAGRGAMRRPTPARANLDFAFDGPIDVAACADGDSAFGCRQMIGNVWEWTASDFLPFAGFAADPYKDYSQPWFGTRKVLRGGCWATSARIARPPIAISSRPTATTSSPASAPAPCEASIRRRCDSARRRWRARGPSAGPTSGRRRSRPR